MLLKNYKKSEKKAFSLTEIAIVMLIISFLIMGIFGGAKMIRSAAINGARSFTTKSVVPQISGLVAWYETSLKESLKPSESYEEAQISSWYDVSPSSLIAQRYDIVKGSAIGQKNVLNTTASNNITYKDKGINDVPSLNFSGNSNLSLSGFFQGSLSQSTIFIVFRPQEIGATLFDSYSSANNSSASFSTNYLTLNAGTSSSTSTLTNSPTFTNNTDYIAAIYFNSDNCKAYVNNAATSAGNSEFNCGTNPLTGITVGSNKNNGSGFKGLISEIIIYNRILQIQERRDVFKYLSYKYQIAVSGI